MSNSVSACHVGVWESSTERKTLPQQHLNEGNAEAVAHASYLALLSSTLQNAFCSPGARAWITLGLLIGRCVSDISELRNKLMVSQGIFPRVYATNGGWRACEVSAPTRQMLMFVRRCDANQWGLTCS